MSHTIYIIKSPNTPKVYIGSTTIELKKCLSRHKSVRGCYSYDVITEGNPSIEELEKVDSSCVKQSLINWNIKFIETTVNKVYNQKLKKSEIKKLEFKKKKEASQEVERRRRGGARKEDDDITWFKQWFEDRIIIGDGLDQRDAYKDYVAYSDRLWVTPKTPIQLYLELSEFCGKEIVSNNKYIYKGYALKPVDNHHSNEDIKVQPK
jgi:hypothetical protein